MSTNEAVTRYYDAWQNKRGDFSDVPLADDFEFSGPVASFDSAEAYRAMAREAGKAVRRSSNPTSARWTSPAARCVGFVTVRPEGLDGDQLRRWVRLAVEFAQLLPPKK